MSAELEKRYFREAIPKGAGMSWDFSSAAAWRNALRFVRVSAIGIAVLAPLAMIANVVHGRPPLRRADVGWGLILFAVVCLPGFAWWLFLRLSEQTLPRK